MKMSAHEDWVVRVQNSVDNMEDMSEESELKEKRCIYRVPDYIRGLDNEACVPQVVSFGPYHHGEPNLEPMEEHKHRALLLFLKKSKKPLQQYIDALAQEVKDLRDAYDQPLPEWVEHDDEVFLKMLIHDGCFILQTLLTLHFYEYLTETPLIVRDMLLLENQVPLRLLVILNAVALDKDTTVAEDLVIRYILAFFELHGRSSEYKGGLHILDVYRRGLVECTRKFVLFTGEFDIPSATVLQEAGIRFKTSKTTILNEITFKGSTLRLPRIMVTRDTKSFFLNLMAFERVLHVGARYEVNSYVYFMGCLIKTDRDASLLRSLGFVPPVLGSDEDVARLFRLISEKAILHRENELVEVIVSVNKKLRNRVRKKLSAWRMDLVQNYLKSPWVILSVIGAIIIFTLTTIQTVYTVLSYTHPKG